MKQEIQKTLISLGLNEKEVKIYIMLLQVGTAPASVLGTRTGIQRSTAQYTCQQLTKKGIIRMIQRSNSYIYTAESPEKLLLLIEEERVKIEKKEQDVQEIVGDLKEIMNPDAEIPKVRFFEGKQEMISLYEEILSKNKNLLSLEDKGEMAEFIPKYCRTFIQKRKSKKIHNKVICPGSNALNGSSLEELRDTLTIPTEKYPFSWDVKICGNLVSIFSFDKKTSVGIAIEHKDISNNFTLLFECLWELLEEKNLQRQ